MLKKKYDNFWSVLYWCWMLGGYTKYLGLSAFSNGWWIFVLPTIWIIHYTVYKLYDYLRGDLLLLS